MSSNLASQSPDKDAIVRLKCPNCQGGLNLRRKHLGISGKCVHCKAPITAVEENGAITLKRTSEVESEKPAATPESVTPPAPTPAASEAATPPVEQFSQSLTDAPTVSKPAPAAEASESAWGFPKREESPVMDEITVPMSEPSVENMEAGVSADVPSLPESFSTMTSSVPDSVETAKEEPSLKTAGDSTAPPLQPTEEEPSSGFGFSSPPQFGTSEVASDSGAEDQKPDLSADPFESKETGASAPPLFSNDDQSSEVTSGWGAKVPSQNHASISPFSTGSAEPDPGFAETLFREKAEEETGKIQPKSPFAELDSNDDTPMASGALFSSNPVATPKATEPQPDKEVILDGDGRPLREMTPEEKEQFAKDIMHFGDFKKKSPWLRRIVRFVMTIAVLVGVGYAAYIFMPEDKVEVAKAKVFDWLEPGSVLMDYLPFEVGESENGEKEVKIKALEGLDNLSSQMDSYLSTAEDQLNGTLPEGAEGYKREKPIDTPELPKMPNIPGLKIPGLTDSGDSESEEAAE